MANISDADISRGLYEKFRVERNDGRSAPGEKHANCEYFVLDLTHDPHALPALTAYAESCKESHPVLSQELESMCALMRSRKTWKQICQQMDKESALDELLPGETDDDRNPPL